MAEAFKLRNGKEKAIFVPVTVSTAFSNGGLVTFTSGELVPAGAATAAVDIFGRIAKDIVAADTDFADARLVSVFVPMEPNNVYDATVTGTFAATAVGTELDLSDATTVDADASAVKVVKVVAYKSATTADVMIKTNGSY